MTGDEIRDARQRAHLTQDELGNMVGVTGRTIGNWERGHSVPRNRKAALEEALSGMDDNPDQVGLLSASDAELVAEIARRFARTPQEARHDRQGDTQQGTQEGSTEHSSEDRREDGGTTGGRTPPMTAEEAQQLAAETPNQDLYGLAANEGESRKPE